MTTYYKLDCRLAQRMEPDLGQHRPPTVGRAIRRGRRATGQLINTVKTSATMWETYLVRIDKPMRVT